MARVVVVIMASFIMGLGFMTVPAQSYQGCAPPMQCAPQRTLVTKMVPCTKVEMVAQVVPCTRTIPVQRVGWTTRKIMLRGTPVGKACGEGGCIKCCPQPFCQVVEQKVPYVYYEYKCVPWYNIVYKPVCHQLVLPQTYCVEATPMCK